MNKWVHHLIFSIVLSSISSVALAMNVAVEFSAEAVQMVPMQAPMTAKMYVSKKAVRTETEFNGQQRVEIIYPQQQRRVLMLPGQKQYMEQRNSKQMKKPQTKKKFNPCAELPDAKCKTMGKETISGRSTEKWEITKVINGRPQRSLHWIDNKRRMAIREVFANGTVSELNFLGKEKMNNRKTEKWQMQISSPDGRKTQSLQWYDPELKMAIREELAGGFVREFKKIKVGKQARHLFTIPKGFQKIEPPMRPQQSLNRPYPQQQ